MIGKRMWMLLFVMLLGGVALSSRLYQIQIVEHELWAREAARLVHNGAVLPYERGSIRDVHGRVLARDKKTYTLALYYRDFRRGNAIGQVAHARSLLEGRAVPLRTAGLAGWARELVQLTPQELQLFGRGGELSVGGVHVSSDSDFARSGRRRRAADVGFYLRRLLGIGAPGREWRALEKRIKNGETEESYLELAARVKTKAGSAITADELEAEVVERVEADAMHLGRLAELLELEADSEGGPATAPLEALVAELEEARRFVEDATASKLFVEATGFAPGRYEPGVLLHYFDLDWIRSLLAWDTARLTEWAVRTRAGWRISWRDQYAVPRLVARLRADGTNPPGPDDLLDGLAAVFGPRGEMERALDGSATHWREVDELAGYDGLAELFGFDGPPKRMAVVPFEESEARSFRPSEPWHLLDRMRVPLPTAPSLGPELQRLFVYGGRSRARSPEEFFGALLDGWEGLFHGAVLAELERLHKLAAEDGKLSADGRLVLGASSRGRAVERADYYLKDFGMRPRFLVRGQPDYRIVWLPTRYPERYAGFSAREARQRIVEILPGDGAPLASELLGVVSSFDVGAIQRQRGARHELARLKNLPDRDAREEIELRELVGSVVLHDQKRGISGVEAFWNDELSGTNGYRESWGLADAMDGERDRVPVREPVDGEDLWLTLDVELQRAAERTLREPPLADDALFDKAWYRNPVGAIVLLTPEGDVLAAASEPGLASLIGPDVVGQRSLLLERTLRRPTFQPPGSVFKPFVAALALDVIGLDPAAVVDCAPIARGQAGYIDVRCHNRFGHGELNLEGAIVHSCNAFFASVGDRLRQRDFRKLGDLFGFGQPTGLRAIPAGSLETRRFGLLEEPVWSGFDRRWKPIERRLAGNGLGVVEATPMQIARATAGLATGVLPQVRIVWRVGDKELTREPGRPIDLPFEHLQRVRDAMAKVAADRGGTAHKALGPRVLGYPIAVKTGSADLTGRRDEDGEYKARKHTWITGWMPPEKPEVIFVVFVHDTVATSSHGAVYVARELLHQPELRDWLASRGLPLEDQW